MPYAQKVCRLLRYAFTGSQIKNLAQRGPDEVAERLPATQGGGGIATSRTRVTVRKTHKMSTAKGIQTLVASVRGRYFTPELAIVGFKLSELGEFIDFRFSGLTQHSKEIVVRVLDQFWQMTKERITRKVMNDVSDFILTNYPNPSTYDKYFNYIRAFLKYLYKLRFDNNIQVLLPVFEKPRVKREIKLMTRRIMVIEDVRSAIRMINEAKPDEKLKFITILQFLTYTGQRPWTMGKLTVGQFRVALLQEPPVLVIEASQDKNRMAHHCPLHPMLIESIKTLIQGKQDNEPMFDYLPFQTWLKNHQVPLMRSQGHLMLKDLRKLFEQKSDELEFQDANKNYIMSHGCGSINWTSYKAFLPENIYAVYMKYWGDVKILPHP